MQITPPFFAPYRQKKEDFFMSEKKVGKRLLTWVLVLVMTLSLLPLNVLAANPAVMRIVRPDTDKYITYNFYLNEGDKTPYYSQIIKNNESLDVPATPEKEGYKFDGWYNGDEQFTTFGTPISVTADSTDVNLYAKFVPVCYVYFMDGKGTDARIIATETLMPEGSLSSEDFNRAALLVPVGAEQAVIGWTKDDEQVGEVSYVEGGSIYLYPIIANGHWITFDSKGGSYVEPQFVTDTTKKPTPPAKPGYDFAGWYTNEETNNEFEFGNILSNNLTLYAKWTPNNRVSYTVIHWWENANDDGYSFHESKTEYGKVGATTSVSAERYNGFTAQTINQETIAGDGSTIVNVYYKRNVYTVKFYSYSSWVSRSEEYTNLRITAKYGANISDKWPTYDGSSTWSTNDSKNEGPYQVNLQTMPLNGDKFYGPKTEWGSETAYYYVEVLPGEASDKTYNRVGYKLHHKDTSPGEGYTITEEDKYPITGFNFKTFEADRTWSGKYAYDNAKFYYTRNSYDIVYVNTGAKGNDNKHTVSYKFEASIADAGNYKPTTVPEGKEGYVFAGWYADPTGETPYDFNKTMPAQNITVYAKWKAPTFTVTVHDSDKKVLTTISNVPLRGTISKDAMPTDDVTLAEGDTFLGWTYEDGTPFNFNTAITQDIELYARVGNKTGYSVTYNYKNGSNLVTDPSKYAKGAFATVFDGPDTAPANKVFLGWTTDENGTEVEYYPNSSIEITGDVTLYAVYGDKAAMVTVTYHNNFGSTDSARTTKAMPNNGEFTVADYTALGLPENNGYEFIGWSTNSGEQKVEFKKGESARADNIGSNDLYAQWKLKTIETEVVVKITGETSTKTYNGSEQSITGYTVESISDSRYTANDFTFSGTALAKGTDAGTYPMGLKPENFENKNANFSKVTFVVTDGSLTITKREVTLTSASDSKVYDGTALTKPEVTVTGSFVDGEVTDIKATGTITDVGTVTNTITFAKGEKFKDSNYAITKTEGTLEVTPITDKVTVTITGNTKTVRYNGKEQSVTGFTYTAPEGVKVTPKDGFKPEAKGTDKGTYYMYLTKGDFIVSSKIYTEFEIIVKDGYLEITRSGGHHPRPKPTVEIEDDDALGLNTTDHFAYIVGYGNGEVRPQNNITRAEVATIFFRLLTDDVRDENLTKTNRYSDVTRADWYNTAVSTLSSMGIITGYPDGTFRPNAAITRAEFAAIAARFDSNGDKTTAKFSDIATHWAKDEISIAYNNGWINGYPNGTFGPQRDITRAETMTLVNRVLNRLPETEDDLLPNMTVWTDNANPNAWYYLAVQEATNSHYYKFKTNSQYEKWTELRETRDWTQLEK